MLYPKDDAMLMRLLLCIAVSISIDLSVPGKVYSQKYPEFETVDELLDWYQVRIDTIEKNYACVGHATISGSASEGFVVYDWFNVGLTQRTAPRSCFYSEVRRTFASGEGSEFWEKYLVRDAKTYYSMSHFSTPMELIPEPKAGKDGKPEVEVSRHMVVPNLFVLAIVNNAAYTALHAEKPYLIHEIEALRLLEGKIENGIAKGFFAGQKWGLEIEFTEAFGWMPTKAKGYFLDMGKKGVIDRSHFSKVQYEVETEWLCIDEDNEVFLPKKVTNHLLNLNRKSKNSQTMEVSAVWILGKTTSDMFSDESVKSELASKGLLNEVKRELFLLETKKSSAK